MDNIEQSLDGSEAVVLPKLATAIYAACNEKYVNGSVCLLLCLLVKYGTLQRFFDGYLCKIKCHQLERDSE